MKYNDYSLYMLINILTLLCTSYGRFTIIGPHEADEYVSSGGTEGRVV